ncbi:ATP-binding protein [Colwelliaceae bacterium 6471]
MSYQVTRNEVFNRYYTAIASIFIAIIIIALSIASYLYIQDLSAQKERESIDLAERARLLNSELQQNVNAIMSMQEFAHYYLNDPHAVPSQRPKFIQDGDRFFLDMPRHDVINRTKHVTGNITGIGKIVAFDDQQNQELAMANALTPAFITAHKSNQYATWYYYLSVKRFINLFPWIGRNNWQYSDRMLDNVNFSKIKALSSDAYSWSPPYLDSAGTGLNTSLGIGVYRGNSFVGAIVIDISLAGIQAKLPDLARENNGYVLIDSLGNVLIHKTSQDLMISKNTNWRDVMPEAITHLSLEEFNEQDTNSLIGDWLVSKQSLPVNNWQLVKYQSYSDFRAPLLNRFMITLVIIVTILMTFFALVYLMTRKTFIKPTKKFIDHIEHCAQGDPGKIKPTSDWLYWFKVVEDIFSQNRSLLQQLKEQNAELDNRVEEKTHALTISIKQHQRDYALLRSVMNAIPDLIIFNDLQGYLIGCNQAFEQYVKRSESEILGKTASALMPNVLGQSLNELYQMSPPAQSVEGQQRVVETLDNTFEVYCGQFNNNKGHTLGSIVIIRDVTTQYSIQAALAQAKDQAELANQAKSQFLANMSHEIRTPINAIQGMMFLLEKTSLNAFQRQYLKNAESASTSLLHLIDELLDLTKIESGNMPIVKGFCPLDLLIDKALKLNIELANSKGLEVFIDIEDDVPFTVLTDEMRLIQVLNNLLNNAVKFTKSGEIRLTVSVTARGDSDALVRFSVADTGIGIEKEKQTHLFDVFRQADESMTREYGGSGLGLSISQHIVNLLGGEITIASEEGKGSDFSFVLPLTVAENDLPQTALSGSVNLYALGVELPALLVASIKKLGWHYRHFSSLEELIAAKLKEKFILLLDHQYSDDAGFQRQAPSWQQLNAQILLVGVCQPAMSTISSGINEELEKLSLPYVLLETPLYRVMLQQLMQGLSADSLSCDVTALLPSQIDSPTEEQRNLVGVNILLVEDNLVNQLVAKELLLSMQADVTVAENGAVALAMLGDSNFDLILMDIQMPVMDGLTATKKIRQLPQYKTLPIIAMTAHARDEDRINSLSAGMDVHIAKPVSAEKLLSTILQVLQPVSDELS